jgi:glycosyltransferase involved in cell wall biosynthesis
MSPLPENPLVSIVTPSYNTGRFIEETLRSVSEQGYPLVEHIVLDSGSTDETAEILARFPTVRLIKTSPCGLSEKLNQGFSIVRGDIVAWLCADDCYLPGAIAKAVDAFKRNPDVALVYSNQLEVDEHSVEIRRKRSKQASFQELLDEANYVGSMCFIRREALERVGLIDIRYHHVLDWDLWIRISRMFPILYVDDWWTSFRVHGGQLSRVHKYASWIEGRKMSREHGARFFSPLFWTYWSGKFSRAGLLLRQGQFRVFNSKLRDFLVGFAWRHGNKKDKKVKPHSSQGRAPPARDQSRTSKRV